MWFNDISLVVLACAGGAAAIWIVLEAIASGSGAMAASLIEQRREREEKRRTEMEGAEAAGRAAGQEPLALNADGTIERPILGLVETR
jgi:hypothetical protein